MRITKVSVSARIGRSVDFQTVAVEAGYDADIAEGEDAEVTMADLRDRALKEVAGTTNKLVDKLDEIAKKG